jgi:hypothetical protein
MCNIGAINQSRTPLDNVFFFLAASGCLEAEVATDCFLLLPWLVNSVQVPLQHSTLCSRVVILGFCHARLAGNANP